MSAFRPGCVLLASMLAGCASSAPAPIHDIVIRGGTIYDGSGGVPLRSGCAVESTRATPVQSSPLS